MALRGIPTVMFETVFFCHIMILTASFLAGDSFLSQYTS
ncbi:hypothetical protein SpAn4DRAFT_1281 [Sporomusa ovata]|uniref:Uncharacterized protein n=1 Tax=Sporomusa ovata TaxID=2378 RepID=A0A0U1KSC7_9FIRM|nr:hypothetical protein SpAn4DRAFT_1281 [Sporomusa ovata]